MYMTYILRRQHESTKGTFYYSNLHYLQNTKHWCV